MGDNRAEFYFPVPPPSQQENASGSNCPGVPSMRVIPVIWPAHAPRAFFSRYLFAKTSK